MRSIRDNGTDTDCVVFGMNDVVRPGAPWRPVSLLLFLLCLGLFLATPVSTSAHAELVRSEPPIDGLVIAPPEQLTLTFTEDVAPSDPAPSVRVLDSQGNEQPVSILPPNGRELVVNLPTLSPGVWTVNWSVRSATDGHQLSGTYGFRVGGGIPAGAATTSGETPEPWAVAARWLTFLGAAIAAAGFLFGVVDPRDRISSRRLAAIAAGALVGLLATLSEPLLLVLSGPNDTDISLGEALRSLPDAWWIRPPALALAMLLAALAVYVFRRRMPSWLAGLGGAASLASLLGLSLTSHAAGRDTWREVAVASDILHQWSVALWIGGLAHLVLAWPFGNGGVPVRRFSKIAVVLFAIGVVTGIANAGFVFPKLETLWNSDYGYVLIAKVAVLVVPLALAVYHRWVIGKVRQIPALFRTTLRIEIVTAAAVVLGGSALALSAPPVVEEPGPDHVTLFQYERNEQGEVVGLVHLRVEPVTNGDNSIEVWLTDLQGNIPPADPMPGVTLDFTSLDHGTVNENTSLNPIDAATLRYGADGLNLSLDGWWQIDATVSRDGGGTTSSSFFLLLPDPNVHGSSSPPTPDDDPAAREVFDRAIATMESQQKFRWSESINTGDDTMVLVNFGQIAASGDQPMAVEQTISYSASFVPRCDGSLPAPPTQDSYHSIRIGDESWLVQPDGSALTQPAGRFADIGEWGNIYEQAEHLRLGGTTELGGEQVQLVSFHTPDQPGQSEAWFVWWVGVDTGRVHLLAMVASSHYMVWEYSDFNGAFTIEPPTSESLPAATPATG
jgi:copper transport protein